LLDCSSFLCHNSLRLLSCLFLVSDGLLTAFARAGIVLGRLAANGQSQTMTDAAVAAYIHQSLDIELHGRTALALDLDAHLGDRRTDGAHLIVVPILNFEVVADTGGLENLAGCG